MSILEPRELTAVERKAWYADAWEEYAAILQEGANGPERLGSSAVPYDPDNLPSWFTRDMRAAAARLSSQDPPALLTLENIGIEMRRRDPFCVPNTERCFLSAALSGGDIPAGVTESVFLVPRHKLIFLALLQLKELGVESKNYVPMLEKLLGDLGEYVKELKGVLPWPSATHGFAASLIKLALERSKP